MGRQRLKILYVEDQPDVSDAVQNTLEAAGHSVVVASEGSVGLDLLLEGAFDIVMVDIGLPFMNGYQLARRAREILANATPPLVAVTAFTGPQDREEAISAGFAAHIAKPASASILLDTIDEVTRNESADRR